MERHILYFVRHGESMGNVKRALLSPEEDILSEDGKVQAGQVGDHLKEVKFTKVVSSDFSRCHNTTKILLSKSSHPEVPIKTEPRLREIGFGIFEGRPYREALMEMAKLTVPIHQWEIPEGETHNQLTARFDSFFKELLSELDKTKEPQTVLICSHSFFLRRMMLCLNTSTYLKPENWDEKCNKLMRNASYMKIAVERMPQDGGDKPRSVNFQVIHGTDHLGEQDDANIKFSQTMSAYQGCIQA